MAEREFNHLRGYQLYVDIDWPDDDNKHPCLTFEPDFGQHPSKPGIKVSDPWDDLIAFAERLKDRLIEARAEYDAEMAKEAESGQ